MKKIIVLSVVAVLIAWRLTTPRHAHPPAPMPPAAPVGKPIADQSPQLQKQRDEVIKQLIADGVISKIEQRPKLLRVYVDNLFYSASFDEKKSVASILYARYFNPDDSFWFISFVDNRSGKQVAECTIHGFSMN